MKSYLFNKYDLELLGFIKTEHPIYIWMNPIQYIFEYDGFYIQMEINCAERFTFGVKSDVYLHDKPSREQYVMSVTLKKINAPFKDQAQSTLLSENEPIIDIYIARTKLCFNEHLPTEEDNHYYFTDYLKNPDAIADGHEAQQSFIVDTGLLIVQANKTLGCYIINNDDDFQSNTLDYAYHLIHDFILNNNDYYKFIKI